MLARGNRVEHRTTRWGGGGGGGVGDRCLEGQRGQGVAKTERSEHRYLAHENWVVIDDQAAQEPDTLGEDPSYRQIYLFCPDEDVAPGRIGRPAAASKPRHAAQVKSAAPISWAAVPMRTVAR